MNTTLIIVLVAFDVFATIFMIGISFRMFLVERLVYLVVEKLYVELSEENSQDSVSQRIEKANADGRN